MGDLGCLRRVSPRISLALHPGYPLTPPNEGPRMLSRPDRLLSALDLARRVEANDITPEGIVDLCAAAIAAREDDVGAFTYLDIEGAKKQAQDKRLTETPLRGMPVGLKDIYETYDMPTEYGSA